MTSSNVQRTQPDSHSKSSVRSVILLGRAGLKADEGNGGAVTLIQRFG